MNLDNIYMEYLKATILGNAELVRVVHSTANGNLPTPRNQSASTDWASVKETLALLATCADAADERRLLGIPRQEIPLPTPDMIERRVQLGQRFTSLWHITAWAKVDAEAAKRLEWQLKTAGEVCTKYLPQIQREAETAMQAGATMARAQPRATPFPPLPISTGENKPHSGCSSVEYTGQKAAGQPAIPTSRRCPTIVRVNTAQHHWLRNSDIVGANRTLILPQHNVEGLVFSWP